MGIALFFRLRFSAPSAPSSWSASRPLLVNITMGISKGVLELQLALGDPDLCRDKAVELLKEGNAVQSAEWFSKAIRARPGDASLYWGRSQAWERAGDRRKAVVDAGVGVCLRPRVAAGFDRLSAAYEAQGRHADVVRACYLGMRCGDYSKNGALGQRMSRAREAGELSPLDWTPIDRRERWAWTFLSFRGFLLRVAAGVAGRLRLGGARLALRACAGGEGFVRPPWPIGAMPPALLLAPEG